MWDPASYLRFGDERARPFGDLLARVEAARPRDVVDLGCGPGQLTAALAARWPMARITGLDSSTEMIDAARSLGAPVRFEIGDVREFTPGPDVDVVVSNATLHWIDGHEALLARWVRQLAPGAWLAFQVPGNFDAPSHHALRAVATQPAWRDRLGHLVCAARVVRDPSGYADLLVQAGCAVDAWETTYLHLLPSDTAGRPPAHPVLDWMEGTALRPVRAELTDPDDWARFRAELAARLAVAYPARGAFVHFPFRRVFCVARVPS